MQCNNATMAFSYLRRPSNDQDQIYYNLFQRNILSILKQRKMCLFNIIYEDCIVFAIKRERGKLLSIYCVSGLGDYQLFGP